MISLAGFGRRRKNAPNRANLKVRGLSAQELSTSLGTERSLTIGVRDEILEGDKIIDRSRIMSRVAFDYAPSASLSKDKRMLKLFNSLQSPAYANPRLSRSLNHSSWSKEDNFNQLNQSTDSSQAVKVGYWSWKPSHQDFNSRSNKFETPKMSSKDLSSTNLLKMSRDPKQMKISTENDKEALPNLLYHAMD